MVEYGCGVQTGETNVLKGVGGDFYDARPQVILDHDRGRDAAPLRCSA
jgi:hypothetical protein